MPRTDIGTSPYPVIRITGSSIPTSMSLVWKSRPLMPGSRTSRIKRPGASTRGACKTRPPTDSCAPRTRPTARDSRGPLASNSSSSTMWMISALRHPLTYSATLPARKGGAMRFASRRSGWPGMSRRRLIVERMIPHVGRQQSGSGGALLLSEDPERRERPVGHGSLLQLAIRSVSKQLGAVRTRVPRSCPATEGALYSRPACAPAHKPQDYPGSSRKRPSSLPQRRDQQWLG